MNKTVKEFMENNFDDKELHAPLFYRFDNGLRFEIGNPEIDMKSKKYLRIVYLKSILLFQEVFKNNDDIYLVINDVLYDNMEQLNSENTVPIEKHFIKESTFTSKKVSISPFFYDKSDSETQSIQYSIKCKVKDIKYKKMLKAIGNYDLKVLPFLSNEIYFIHIKKKIIYYLYDDRGLDIVSSNPIDLKNLYENYGQWILKYDEEKIRTLMENI